jgi:hypothetical protein
MNFRIAEKPYVFLYFVCALKGKYSEWSESLLCACREEVLVSFTRVAEALA